MQRIIAVVSFAIIFSSCTNKSQSDLAVFKATEEGLDQSNKTIFNSTSLIYHELEKKLSEHVTAQQASVWQPTAIEVKERSEEMTKYLESLINKLEEEAGLKSENDKLVFKEDDRDAVIRLFINEKKGDELYEKLQKYKQDILDVDPEIFKVFSENAIIITRTFEADTNRAKDFTKTFFYKQPVISALASLRKFENNVRVLENKFVTFCFNKIGMVDGDSFFTQSSVLVSQSTNHIKAGDELKIKAGVGSFSSGANPKITINGKEIQVLDGVALYKFKTPLKAGKYYVPVKIEYTAPDGRREVKTEILEYSVIE